MAYLFVIRKLYYNIAFSDMNLQGTSLKFTSRQCFPGVSILSGKCLAQDIPIEVQQIKANMCVCNTDECNSAPFSAQASFFGLLLPIIVSMVAF